MLTFTLALACELDDEAEDGTEEEDDENEKVNENADEDDDDEDEHEEPDEDVGLRGTETRYPGGVMSNRTKLRTAKKSRRITSSRTCLNGLSKRPAAPDKGEHAQTGKWSQNFT